MSCDFIGVCVEVACAGKIYIMRMLGHVALLLSATCGQIKVTASVTDPLLHAIVDSLNLVLDPAFIYTKSKKN